MTRPETSAGGTAMESDLLDCMPRLRRYARYLTRDDDRAGDLVQDTVVKALTAASQFQAGTSLMSWTTRILRNRFYDDMRRRRKEMRWLEDRPDVEGSTKPHQEISLDLFDFRRAYWQLEEDQRKALILVGAVGLSHTEAAILCDCRVGTVKSRVHRARRELQRILQEGPFCADAPAGRGRTRLRRGFKIGVGAEGVNKHDNAAIIADAPASASANGGRSSATPR